MNKWNFYTSGEIKPRGWLKRQLEIQAAGLSGNLDKVWRDVKESGWIGGEGEAWERFPYWLDGFVPLAYLLEDEDMIERVKNYIDYIIAHQKPSGWICPCPEENLAEYNTWSLIIFSKAFVTYYQCSKDDRVPTVLYKALKNYYELLASGEIKLFGCSKFRWYECFIAINFLYERTHEDWLRSLAKILNEQGLQLIESTDLWEGVYDEVIHETHIVNIATALKYEVVSCDILGEEFMDAASFMYDKLCEYHGTPVGIFTGDEHLSGLSPIQGTELCGIVDLMYSMELIYAYTGDSKWAERLELLAFNALPATISDDMWTHQYDQMSNQIACIRFPDKPIFRTNFGNAHLFGLEPHYGCCTANFSQGWPKFALSAFMHAGDTIINVLPVPSSLSCDKAQITLETNYPFENRFKYKIKAAENFEFRVRIPSFAKNITAQASSFDGNELSFKISAGEEREILISFDAEAHFEGRPHGLNIVKCGSLVFSLPIKYKTKMYEYGDIVPRRFPYCDYEYIPASEWQYAYTDIDPKAVFTEISSTPFSSKYPAVTVKARVKPINWGYEDGYDTVCAKIPKSTEPTGEEETILLYPYGCAKLRMTELPIIK